MKLAALALLATPAAASDVVAEWRDLHGRCQQAVATGAMLDVSGLDARDPTSIADVVEEPPFGVRIDYDALRTSARTAPTGIWGASGGRFEMTLIEFVTRPGVRAICEVGVAREVATLGAGEAKKIPGAFRDMRAAETVAGTFEAKAFDADAGTVRDGMTLAEANPRGCPVVVSLTSGPGYFRTSAAERAGVPECGGPSLAKGGLTTSPAELNRRSTP